MASVRRTVGVPDGERGHADPDGERRARGGPGQDDLPTCDAAELLEAGDDEGAREILMDVLCADLRCVDAHALLGNLEFERRPERAIVHYEMGIRIGERSLPSGFDGALLWGRLYNRPFLRCHDGFGLDDGPRSRCGSRTSSHG